MKYAFILSVVLFLVTVSSIDARLTIRHRRQVEREDSELSSDGKIPAGEVVVIKDTVNPSLPGPLFLVPRLPGPGDAFDLDINEQDGTFSFGGQLPAHFHHHHNVGHQSFAGLFDAIQRRFDEMTRNMMSFNNFGPGFSPTTDISTLPDDYNKTDSEIVELNGHRYVKKTTTLKKGGPGATFFVRSTTFERVNENENADNPPVAPEESIPDEKKVIGGGAEDGIMEKDGPKVPVNTSTGNDTDDDDAKDNGPAVIPDASSSSVVPDVVPSSSTEAPADPAADSDDAKDTNTSNNDESNDTSGEREREGEPVSSSSTTEQP